MNQKQHELLNIDKALKTKNNPASPNEIAHRRPSPHSPSQRHRQLLQQQSVEKKISNLNSLLSSNDSPYIYTNNNETQRLTSSPTNLAIKTNKRRTKKINEPERSLLYTYIDAKNGSNTGLNSNSGSESNLMVSTTAGAESSPRLERKPAHNDTEKNRKLSTDSKINPESISNNNSNLSTTSSRKSAMTFQIPQFKKPNPPKLPSQSGNKSNLQAKVYNFLERPTGWLCFIYHFTV